MGWFSKQKKDSEHLELYKSLYKKQKEENSILKKENNILKDENSHLAGDSLRHGSKYGARTMNNRKKSKSKL